MLRGDVSFAQGVESGTILVRGAKERADAFFALLDFTYPAIRLNGVK